LTLNYRVTTPDVGTETKSEAKLKYSEESEEEQKVEGK